MLKQRGGVFFDVVLVVPPNIIPLVHRFGCVLGRDVRVWNTLFFNAIATVGVCVFLLLCYHRSAGVIYSFWLCEPRLTLGFIPSLTHL